MVSSAVHPTQDKVGTNLATIPVNQSDREFYASHRIVKSIFLVLIGAEVVSQSETVKNEEALFKTTFYSTRSQKVRHCNLKKASAVTDLYNMSCRMLTAMTTRGFLPLFREKMVRLDDSMPVVFSVSAAVPAPQQLETIKRDEKQR